MRKTDIEWVSHIIRSSGIANKTQREAMVQRLLDANANVAYHRELHKKHKYTKPLDLATIIKDVDKKETS